MRARFSIATVIATLLCIFMAPVWAAETPPKLKEGNLPRYDRAARAMYEEGWVYLMLHVTKDGDVQDIRVTTSYPKGTFDDEAVKAVQNWKFNPKRVNGTPTDEPNHAIAITFGMEGQRGVTGRYMPYFKSALGASRARDKAKMESSISKLREKFEEQRFNLTEVARYYQFESLLAIDQKDYIKAAEFIERCLRLASFLDNKNVVDNLHYQMLTAFVGINQFHNAVDYYDSWRQVAKVEIRPELSTAIEDLRKAGYGYGREFEIATYKDKVTSSRQSSKMPKPGQESKTSAP